MKRGIISFSLIICSLLVGGCGGNIPDAPAITRQDNNSANLQTDPNIVSSPSSVETSSNTSDTQDFTLVGSGKNNSLNEVSSAKPPQQQAYSPVGTKVIPKTNTTVIQAPPQPQLTMQQLRERLNTLIAQERQLSNYSNENIKYDVPSRKRKLKK